MKKHLLISSLVAITAVIGGANAGTITDSDSTDFTIVTNGAELGANANMLPTYQAIEGAMETYWNNAEAWIGGELGYDTTTTDAKTVLHAAGFTADDFLGAVTENKAAIGDVDYSDIAAVEGSTLKTGAGATTTVEGALNALDAGKQAKITDSSTIVADGTGFKVKDASIDTTQLSAGVNTSLGHADDAYAAAVTNKTTAVASDNTNLITSAGVYANAKSASYNTTATDNIAANSTIGGAIGSLDTAMGNRNYVSDGSYAGSLLSDGQTVGASILALANNAEDITAVLGTKQTSAAASGLLNGEKIGDTVSVIDALDTVAKNAAGTGLANTFTGANTFKNDAGVTIKSGDASKTTALTATADGLNVSTGMKVNGNEIVTGTSSATSFNAGANGTSLADNSLTLADASSHTSALSAITDGASGSLLNVSTGMKVNGNETVTGTLGVTGASTFTGKVTANGGVDTTTLNATTVNAGTNGTSLADNSLTLSNGTNTATLGTVAIDTTHDALNIAGVSGVKAGGFLATDGNLGFSTDYFTADDSKIKLEDASGNTMFKVDNTGTMVLKDASGNTKFQAKNDGTMELAGQAKVGSLTFNGTNSVNAIDTGASAVTGAGSASTIATTATVMKSAENAAYTGTKAKTATASTTLTSALSETTAALNNVLTAAGTEVDSAKVDVQWNSTDSTLATVLGNGAYTSVTNIAAGDSITTALSKLDAELGADSAYTAMNGVAGTNTVKANINAVNATIGNITSLAAGTGSTGNAITNGTGTKPTTVVAAINNIDATLGQIHGLKMGNSTLKANSNLAAGTTVEDHLVSLDNAIGNRNGYTHEYNIAKGESIATSLDKIDNAIGNRTYVNNKTVNYAAVTASTDVTNAISQVASNVGAAATAAKGNITATNTVNANLDQLDTAIGDRSSVASLNTAINSAIATDVATAFTTTGNLIGDMDFSAANYIAAATNVSDALRALDNNLQRVEHKLHKVEYNLKSGLAAMSALSALVPNARDCGNTQISVGTGNYADRFGIAVGGFHYFNDHVLFNAGASYGGTKDWAFRAGITFGL